MGKTRLIYLSWTNSPKKGFPSIVLVEGWLEDAGGEVWLSGDAPIDIDCVSMACKWPTQCYYSDALSSN